MKKIPIIMLTSADHPEHLRKARFAGIDRCLVKPVKQSDLFNAITRIMGVASHPEVAEPDDGEAAPIRPLRILLAEDGLVNQRVATDLLALHGHQVIIARNGREAVDYFAAQDFDLILMDVHMPELDGHDATRTIRRREEQSGNSEPIPIIALTANAMKGDREKCLASGMDDYMSKPIRASELYQTISRNAPESPIGPDADYQPPTRGGSKKNAGGGPARPLAFDRATALRTVDGSEEMLAMTVEVYYEETDELLPKLDSALAAGDAELLERASHTMKSSAASIGCESVRESAAQLEALGKAGKLAKAPELVDELKSKLKRLLEDLEKEWPRK